MPDKPCYCCGHDETTEEEFITYSEPPHAASRPVCELCKCIPRDVNGVRSADQIHQSRCTHAVIAAIRAAGPPDFI